MPEGLSALPDRLQTIGWNNRSGRAVIIQAAVVAGVLGALWYFIDNAVENIAARGLTSGFGFLRDASGMSIATTLIPFTPESTYADAFLVGALNTLFVSMCGIVLATALGFFIGICRLSKNWLISRLATVYVEIFRNIPLLVQMFFWYFAVLRALPPARLSLRLDDKIFLNSRGLYLPRPIFEPGFWTVIAALCLALIVTTVISLLAKARQNKTGRVIPTFGISAAIVVALPAVAAFASDLPLTWDIPLIRGFNVVGGLVVIPEFLAVLVAISIYTAAYISEIVRGGILSISAGQTDAAMSLGLSSRYTLNLVIIPQSLRVIIPPLTTQYLNLVKNTSLAGAIAYPDLVLIFDGTVLSQTGQAIECIAMSMAFYLTISLSIAAFMNWYNSRKALVER